MRFEWSDHKSQKGSRSVRFNGGLEVYATRQTPSFYRWSDKWRVSIVCNGKWDRAVIKHPIFSKRFTTRTAAMAAAEKMLGIVQLLAIYFVSLEGKISISSGINERSENLP